MVASECSSLADARTRFLSMIDELAQGEGLPPIAGRMFGVLVFDGGPISFSDLAQRLEVSRASVSTSARALEAHGLVQRIKMPGKRCVFFDLVPDRYARLLHDARARAQRGAEGIDRVRRALPPTDPSRIARLRDLSQFYQTLHDATDRALQQLSGDHHE